MRRSTLALFAGALLLAAPALAQKAKPFFPYPMKTTVLPNGLSVTRIPFSAPGIVSFYSAVRVGSRNEVEPGHTGFAHFFEHVMFKGTQAWPEGTRDALLGRLGFHENAFTSDDITVYHVTGPTSGLEKLIELEADRFRNLAFSEQTFQTEAKAVLGEYHKSAANPGLKMEEALGATAFTTHTYRHTTLGFYEDIQLMPTRYEYSKQFFKRWYTPDNVMIFIVGDFDDAKAMEWIRQRYGAWEGKAANVEVPREPPQTSERSVHIDWPGVTLPRVLYAWHTPQASLQTLDGAIQNVLAAYLAGPTSPLYRSLVLEKQLAESVSSGYGDHRDPTLFTIIATLKDEKHRDEVRQAMDAAVRELASGKVDKKRVQAVKDNLRYGLLMSLETPDQVALQLAYYAGVLGQPNALDLFYRSMSQVKPEQLVAFAKKHLVTTNRTVLTLSPKPAGGAP